jgi:L-alanine-DL-glutamate epimerase-like enolase superfamily enzyme
VSTPTARGADPPEALANLRSLVGAGIELAEEPVHGIAALRAVREQSPIPVAMDETAAEAGALTAGAADAICLKVSRCGGISALMDQAALARAGGAHVYVASTFDGPLGVAAGLHAAAALSASGPVAPCGLATLPWFEGLPDVLPIEDGTMRVPSGPGLLGMTPLN